MVYPATQQQLPGTPYTATTYESQQSQTAPRFSSAQAHFYKQLRAAARTLGLTSSIATTSSAPQSNVLPSQALGASQPGRQPRPTLSVPFHRQEPLASFERQRITYIRYHQQVLAYLAAMSAMTFNVDGSGVPQSHFGTGLACEDKTDGGFNPSFGLNPMSADDPSWIGHGFQAQAAEDFLSSPEWTDPSPALTDSMSFDLESCDPSPLLPLDSYDGEHGIPGIAGAPLFSPMDGYASSNVSPLEASHQDFGAATVGDFGASEMGPDFTLFPEVASERKRPAEMAFSQVQPAQEDPAVTLLRALSSAALQSASVAAPAAVGSMSASTPALTAAAVSSLVASPLMASGGSIPPVAVSQPPQEAPVVTAAPASVTTDKAAGPTDRAGSPELVRRTSSLSSSSKSESRGSKRRLDVTDLLPLDAPIQPRKYHTVSATSRRDTPNTGSATPVPDGEDPFAEEEAAIRKEKDPRIAKRLSNTLAARRSRHRKAEELRTLHETIDSLRNEVEMWKKRCERAERERDEVRA